MPDMVDTLVAYAQKVGPCVKLDYLTRYCTLELGFCSLSQAQTVEGLFRKATKTKDGQKVKAFDMVLEPYEAFAGAVVGGVSLPPLPMAATAASTAAATSMPLDWHRGHGGSRSQSASRSRSRSRERDHRRQAAEPYRSRSPSGPRGHSAHRAPVAAYQPRSGGEGGGGHGGGWNNGARRGYHRDEVRSWAADSPAASGGAPSFAHRAPVQRSHPDSRTGYDAALPYGTCPVLLAARWP